MSAPAAAPSTFACNVCGAAGGLRCSRCHASSIHYCSKDCQLKDWPSHKLTCNKDGKPISTAAAVSALAEAPRHVTAVAAPAGGPTPRVLTKEALHAMLDTMPTPIAAQQLMRALTHIPPEIAAVLDRHKPPPVVGMDLLVNMLTHPRAMDIMMCTEGMNTSVMESVCARGNVLAVRMILSRCPSDRMASLVNLRDPRARGTPLMAAVANGRAEVIALLLATTLVDVNAACARVEGNEGSAGMVGCTALHFAAQARRKDCSVIQQLLDAGADVNATDHAGVTPLMFACTLPGGPPAWDIPIPPRDTLLEESKIAEPAEAAAAPSSSVLKSTVLPDDVVDRLREIVHAYGGEASGADAALLISRGADVHASTIHGRTAVDYAVADGNTAAYAVCACAGADVTPVVVESTQITYLHLATHMDAVGVLRCAHAVGVDIEVSDAQGRSPFMHACALDARACVRALVEQLGAHMEDPQPLLSAVTMDKLDVASYLLRHGVVHEGAGVQELPLLTYALQRCAERDANAAGGKCTPREWRKFTRALLAAGARVDDVEGVSKWTAMHMAIACATADIITLMWTSAGAEACVNALTTRGKYSRVLVQPRSGVIHVAAARGDMAVMKAVCEGPHASKMKRSAQDEEGNTALHVAGACCVFSVRGCDTCTAIALCAARELYADVIVYLVTAQKEGGVGVDAGLRNAEGCTALQLFDRAFSLRTAGGIVRMMSNEPGAAETTPLTGSAEEKNRPLQPAGKDASPEALLRAREALAAATAARARSMCSCCYALPSCVVM